MPLDIHPERSRVELTDLHRGDRSRLRSILGGVLAGCAVMAVLYAFVYMKPARAEEIPVHVGEIQGAVIRLMPSPCADPRSQFMLMNGLPQYLDRFKAIDSEWPMQNGTRRRFAGCWAEFAAGEIGPEEAFVLVFEDGQGGALKKSDFLKKPGQGGA